MRSPCALCHALYEMYPLPPGQKLSGLLRGQTAQVTSLCGDSPLRRRFQDLGLIEGTQVECLGASPLGDPCAYLIRGAVIALRRCDADTVSVTVPLEAQAGAAPSPAPTAAPAAE